MEKTRVLFVTSEEYFGSIAKTVAMQIRFLDRSRFETGVVCPPGEASGRFKSEGALTFPLVMPTKYDPRPVLGLRRVLSAFKPHIINAQTMRSAWFCALAARPVGTALVKSEHNWTEEILRLPTDESPKALTRMLLKLLTKGPIDKVIVFSRSSAGFYLKGQGLDPAKLVTVRAAVDGPGEELDSARALRLAHGLRLKEGSKIVSSFGRHDLVKGFTYLVEAMPRILAEHPNTVFCLFGDGKQRQALESQAGRLGVSEMARFPGWTDDVYAMLALTDVVVMPSLSEVAGQSVMEAMAAGKPLVVTDVGALREYAGEDALSVPPMDAKALARAVNRLLASKELRKRLGEAARTRYERLFLPQRFVSDMERLYVDLRTNADRRGDSSYDCQDGQSGRPS
ncbi:MAG: glycosyltransferase family 1 protein [Actinobacteria bacterium]|nr:MAG: glycosyltransferase family 1 protein [Actinomycetota bacterium]